MDRKSTQNPLNNSEIHTHKECYDEIMISTDFICYDEIS